MNIDSPYIKTAEPGTPEFLEALLPVSENNTQPEEEDSPLFGLLPRIREALSHLDYSGRGESPADSCPAEHPGARIIDLLSDSIGRLQDIFMENLYSALAETGADAEQKLTLRLEGNARLAHAGAHPKCEAVNALLNARPDLSAAFTAIAVQSALLRDLRSLQSVSLYASNRDSYAALTAVPGESIYQLSLKGDMSHFYFTR